MGITIQRQPFNWFPYFILIIIWVLFFILFSRFKSCESKNINIDYDSTLILKQQIKKDIKDRDSLIKLANKKDSVRIETIVKYKWLKGKTDTVPCEDLLPLVYNVCDSIIIVDSSEISILRDVIKNDSVIICNYQKVSYNDSICIIGLKKQVKCQKVKTRLAWIVAGVLGGVAFVK